MRLVPRVFVIAAVAFIFATASPAANTDSNQPALEALLEKLSLEMHGFAEMRVGARLQSDQYQKTISIMEARAQVDLTSYPDWGDVKIKADVYGDGVTERGEFDLREANIFLRPLDFVDLKIGRQPLTWGTGDLIFINDLFPKDWQSFFIGRDVEYLKAPSDAVKASFFSDWVNLDVAYTPEFDADRYISGERISYWNQMLLRRAGRDATADVDRPSRWFRDDELATRIYKNIKNYELALYCYWGFWKSPVGVNPALTQATFPELNVYGSSVRGPLSKGIFNAEIGYYDSADDRAGSNWRINNSEMRYLIGYTQEIAKDFTAGLQYYIEQMLDYNNYLANLPAGPARDEFRHVATLRLTKLMMNQNLRLSFFTYYSPTDKDVYMRPIANYKVSDNLAVELGANIFFGNYPNTFFAQFENNTNLHTALRYSF